MVRHGDARMETVSVATLAGEAWVWRHAHVRNASKLGNAAWVA